ncbi:MAG: ABC transporter ATP-binding protein [Planctomycetes bacterium]|nr:ABC transporter ATP-binding protein [Planctomycetota bacterium]
MSGPDRIGPAVGIAASELQFGYRPEKLVLDGVSITAPAGALTCILGPNGSGKTTLLRCLMGRLVPRTGQVMVGDKSIRKLPARQAARLLAYVPQTPACAFEFSARQIVLMGRTAHSGMLGLAGRQDSAVADLAMKMTDTLHLAGRTLSELSGGEAQRVMVARALAQQPAVMLLDEPTSHLDIKSQLVIHEMMRRLAHEWGMAVVCVSHDVELAGRFADQLVLMKAGKVLADGPPRDVLRRDLLSEAYEVQVELLTAPGADSPIIRASLPR